MTTKQYENIELAFLQSQFVTAKNISKIRTLPYAFTRNGVGMLSSVLGSETAVDMNIRIMRAFTASQQIMESHAILYKRVFNLEQHQQETDEKINLLMTKMDDNSPKLRTTIRLNSCLNRYLAQVAYGMHGRLFLIW